MTDAGTESNTTDYTWSGDEVTWDKGSAVYNAYGYVLSQRILVAEGVEEVTTVTYDDCGE